MNMKPVDYSNQQFETEEMVVNVKGINISKNSNRWYDVFSRKLTATQFLKLVLIASLAFILVTVAINVSFDIYGLFRPVNGRQLPVYNNERVSKYLLAHRYIPQNFDAVILGTSLSANLEVSDYNKLNSSRIYNASVMGANISELTPLAEKLIDGGVKNMIVCFSPYMTKDHGSKEVNFDSKLYFGALGSKNLYETYVVALIREFELMPNKFPKNQINEYGVNRYGSLFKVDDVKGKIRKVIDADKGKGLTIHPESKKELAALIKTLQDRNINFIGYFHPVPFEVYESKKEDYEKFEQLVRSLVNDDSKLTNFNSVDFQSFTKDYSNYIDHGHLSDQGQKHISKLLLDKFNMN
jgi:hypothetical protein